MNPVFERARAHPYLPGRAIVPAPNPLDVVDWTAAYWAGDPEWSNPGDGNPVASWRDGSGALHPLGATGTARPTYRSSVAALNGSPGVEFDGTSDTMTAAIGALLQPYTIVIVAEILPVNFAGTPCLIDGGSAGRAALFVNGAGGGWAYYAGGAALIDGPTATIGRKAFRIHADNASSEVNRNMRSLKGSLGTTSGITGLTVGNAFNLTNFANMALAFLGVYSGDITDDPGWPLLISTTKRLFGANLA